MSCIHHTFHGNTVDLHFFPDPLSRVEKGLGMRLCMPMTLSIQSTKFKFHQYQLRAVSPNLMLTSSVILCSVARCWFSVYTVLSSLLVAPPLTTDTLLPLLKGVKSWRKLAKELIWTYDYDDDDDGILHIIGEDLDVLQSQHGSDEECLKAVIDKFLEGNGGQYEQPSWRAVLQSLYNANEFQLAFSIKSYAEPLQGVCTVDV